ncbi:hypothetical protein ACTA71_007500 [Dictyostelium dimigraforme]
MSSKIGFVQQATKQIVYKQPRFYINPEQCKFNDTIMEESLIHLWKNDRETNLEEYQERHVKPSRVKFLRKKQIQKYKWDHFMHYICENYETVREKFVFTYQQQQQQQQHAREISRGPSRLAKIERANSWLGDYHD